MQNDCLHLQLYLKHSSIQGLEGIQTEALHSAKYESWVGKQNL